MFEQKIELEKTWQLNIKLDIEIASIAVVADCFARVSVTESAGEGWFCTTSSNFLGILFDCKTMHRWEEYFLDLSKSNTVYV